MPNKLRDEFKSNRVVTTYNPGNTHKDTPNQEGEYRAIVLYVRCSAISGGALKAYLEVAPDGSNKWYKTDAVIDITAAGNYRAVANYVSGKFRVSVDYTGTNDATIDDVQISTLD